MRGCLSRKLYHGTLSFFLTSLLAACCCSVSRGQCVVVGQRRVRRDGPWRFGGQNRAVDHTDRHRWPSRQCQYVARSRAYLLCGRGSHCLCGLDDDVWVSRRSRVWLSTLAGAHGYGSIVCLRLRELRSAGSGESALSDGADSRRVFAAVSTQAHGGGDIHLCGLPAQV